MTLEIGVLIVNQLVIFGGCFSPYCILAALPHTGIITGFLIYYIYKVNEEAEKEQEAREGKVFERVGSSFRHKGKAWAEEELDPVIKASREAKLKSDEILAKLLAQ